MKDVDILYKYFNSTIFCLIDDLSSVYPAEKWKLVVVKLIINKYITKNVAGIHTAFRAGIDPYKTRLLENDETFFMTVPVNDLKTEYKTIMASLGDDVAKMKDDAQGKVGKSTFTQLVNLIRQRWAMMDAENKDVVWAYMKKLMEYDEELRKCKQDAPNPEK
jgi:hypothetical protein